MARHEAEQYRAASAEHIHSAEDMHEQQRYLLSHFLAGLSVECMLRAYRWQVDPHFDGRHNIIRLYESSGYDRIVPKKMKEDVGAWLTMVDLRWSNTYRYETNESLRRRLLELKLQGKTPDSILSDSSKQLLDASIQLVQLGEVKWLR